MEWRIVQYGELPQQENGVAHVMAYECFNGEYRLPKLVPGTENSTVTARPGGAELAATIAPAVVSIAVAGTEYGEWCGQKEVLIGTYVVVPCLGDMFSVSPRDVRTCAAAKGDASYELIDAVAATDAARLLVPVLDHFWASAGYNNLTSYRLRRIAPAKVIGEIAEDAVAGTLYTNGGAYATSSALWWGNPRLVIVEYGLENFRVVPLRFLERQFSEWRSADGNILEIFPGDNS